MCSIDIVLNNPTSTPMSVGAFNQGSSITHLRAVNPHSQVLLRAPAAHDVYIVVADGTQTYQSARVVDGVALDWIFRVDSPVAPVLIHVPVSRQCGIGQVPHTVQSVSSSVQQVLSADVARDGNHTLAISVHRAALAEPATYSSILLGFLVAIGIIAGIALGATVVVHSGKRRSVPLPPDMHAKS